MSKKKLLITFDAFGTLFTPKEPIAKQYVDVARKHGLESLDPKRIGVSFKTAFNKESVLHPNYGKASGMKAPGWWANVIKATFQPFSSSLPSRLVPDLLERFSGSEAYSLHPSVIPFFEMVRKKKQSSTGDQKAWLWDHTVVGILTNSDDRIPGILASFGLNVGSKRFGTPIEHAEDASEDEDINFVVLSSDVGVEKPDPKIFDAAEEVLKASLGRNDQNGGMIGSLPHNKAKHSLKEFELLHIGDNEQQDILGALNAGWNSILFDRKGRYSKEFSKGEAILSVDLRTSARRWTLVGRNVPVTQDLNALRYWKPSSV